MTRAASAALALVSLCAAAPAAAEVELGAGPAVLLTGSAGAPLRGDVAIFVDVHRRVAVGACACAIGGRDGGLAVARVALSPAASPPRLYPRLFGEAGVAWALAAPVVGAGAGATLRVARSLAVSLEAELHLVVDGVAHTHAMLGFGLRAALRF